MALLSKLKIEISITAIFVMLKFIKNDALCEIINNLSTYYTESRLNNIVTFVSISIGVYMAIISILATTSTSVSEKIVERKLDDGLIALTCSGIIEGSFLMGLIIFVADTSPDLYYLITLLIIIFSISFLKFIIFVILAYKYNLSTIAKQVDEKNNLKNDILHLLEQIEKNTLK